jgi:predicted  nucleic acid-binding Zn-ribbon protein
MSSDLEFLQGRLRHLESEKHGLEISLERSKNSLRQATAELAEKEEAIYLSRIADRFPSRGKTMSSLETVVQEKQSLEQRMQQLEKAEARKRTQAMLLCHAVEELRNDLHAELATSESMSVVSSSISDISIA